MVNATIARYGQGWRKSMTIAKIVHKRLRSLYNGKVNEAAARFLLLFFTRRGLG